jgi:hypothetical protein
VALRLHIPIPAGARPGSRTYEIEVRAGDETSRLRLEVRVHRAAVPPVGRASFPYTNWFSFERMAERHGLKPWGDSHWHMIGRYAALMAHGRQNTFLIPLPVMFRMAGGKPVLDRRRLTRIVKAFTEAGLHTIEGGHVAHRTGGAWEATTFDTALGKVRATSPAGNEILASVGSQLMAEIRRNGWEDRWVQHVTDEPTARNAADYRILTGMVRKVMPGVPILDATMDPALVGAVDIWCPQAQEYQKHRREFERQRELGDRIWFYTCCFPGGHWLNRLLDMELLRPCLFGWAAALYGLDGFLHWGLNQYRSDQDPFEQSVVKHGGANSLPAGDTHIVYPGDGGPWSSLRLEAQREGLEDYELLRQLRDRDSGKATEIVRSVIRGFDKYTRDPARLRAARGALLSALG